MSDYWGTMPAPPGVTPNLVNPDDLKGMNVSVHTVCLALVAGFLAMRLYTRHFITRSLWWDDLFLLLSFFSTVVGSALVIMSYKYGIGRHIWDVPRGWIMTAVKFISIASYVYQVTGTTTRLAILTVYYRIFHVSRGMRRTVVISCIAIAIFNTSFLFAMFMVCNPPAKAWNPTLKGKCYNPKPIVYTSAGLNMAEDLFIFILPQPMIFKMKMPWIRKVRIGALFGLGILSLAASMVRLVSTQKVNSSNDTTRNFAHMMFWGVIEINVAIMCACLVVVPAFLEHFWPSRNGTHSDKTIGTESRIMRSTFGRTGKQINFGWPHNSSTHTSDENLTTSNMMSGHKGGITVTQDIELKVSPISERGAEEMQRAETSRR